MSLRSVESCPHTLLRELQKLEKTPQRLQQDFACTKTLFQSINNHYGWYSQSPAFQIIELFRELSERCQTLATLFEESDLQGRSLRDDCAYKLMVLFFNDPQERGLENALELIASKADKYFRRIDVKVSQPLHDLLFLKRLPCQKEVSDFPGWKIFIQKYGPEAMRYFAFALKIEQKNQGRAPTTLQKAQAIWAQCLYSRASEDFKFAELCYQYGVSEEDFSKSLDYLCGKNQNEALAVWPKKPVDSDTIPNIVVEGKDEAYGYYWVKLAQMIKEL